eukprot:jgi/Mesen1/3756/ME000205S03022
MLVDEGLRTSDSRQLSWMYDNWPLLLLQETVGNMNFGSAFNDPNVPLPPLVPDHGGTCSSFQGNSGSNFLDPSSGLFQVITGSGFHLHREQGWGGANLDMDLSGGLQLLRETSGNLQMQREQHNFLHRDGNNDRLDRLQDSSTGGFYRNLHEGYLGAYGQAQAQGQAQAHAQAPGPALGPGEDLESGAAGGEAASEAAAGAGAGAGGVTGKPQMASRYESQKRRDWNTFGQYLKNHRPPIPMSRCAAPHVTDFLRYLDQFGKTKVHIASCQFYGASGANPCGCPMKQAWGSLDSLVGRLRAAYEENGGRPENNPFGARSVRLYLRETREHQAKARGIARVGGTAGSA